MLNRTDPYIMKLYLPILLFSVQLLTLMYIPTNRPVHRTIGHTGHAQTSKHMHRTSQNQ